MKKKLLLIAILLLLILTTAFGCKKKKHNWHEVGAEPVPPIEHFGVQYSKGTESNPAKVYLASVYIPTGRDEKGDSQYKTIIYELEELTPDNLAKALVDCGVLTEECLFVDLTIEKSDVEVAIGPGAEGKMKDKQGTVRFVEVDSPLINISDYEDPNTGEIYEGKKAKGLIDTYDIYGAINYTYMENFQLVSCSFEPANMEDYRNAHK